MRQMPPRLAPWTFAIAGFAPFAMAQSQDRATVAGQVVSLDGGPVTAAQVTLVHRPIGWCAQYGDVDVVRVATDAKGRFRAEVLPARPYSAFATWQTGAKPVASAVVEHVAAGAFVTLQAQESAVVAVTVRVDGQEPWADVGPLGFRVVPRIAHLWPIPLTPNADRTVTLPTLPNTSALLEVTTRDGHILFSTWVAHEERREPLANDGPASANELRVVRLPPPVPIPVQVFDAASGKPVAGAEIELRSSWLGYRVAFPTLDSVSFAREYWRPVGKTDAEGHATVTVPADAGPWPLPEDIHIALSVRAGNYAIAFGGWTSGSAFWDRKAQPENPNPLRIPLHAQRPVTGRLTLDGTTPAANLPVILWTEAVVINQSGGGGSNWDAPVQFATTDAKGSFVFPYAPRGPLPLRIGVALDRGDLRQRLAVDGLAPMLLAVPFREAGTRSAFGRDENVRELGEASLGSEAPVAVRLVDSQGSPLRGVEVFLLPVKSTSSVIAAHNTTDGAGRCLLFPAAAGELLVAAVPGLGYVIAPVTGDRAQEVRLVPFSLVTGKVIQADGTAAAAATLGCSGMRTTVRGNMSDQDHALNGIAQQLNDHFAKGTCDRDGRFRLPIVPMRAAALRIHAILGTADERQTATVMIECDPDSTPAPIEVRLGR